VFSEREEPKEGGESEITKTGISSFEEKGGTWVGPAMTWATAGIRRSSAFQGGEHEKRSKRKGSTIKYKRGEKSERQRDHK